MRSSKNPAAFTSQGKTRSREYGKKLRIRWAYILLPVVILYFALLIRVETLLSSASRRTERLEAMRDSLRMELVLSSANVTEGLSLESVIPLAERSRLMRCVPDQLTLVPTDAPSPELTVWASVLKTVTQGLMGSEEVTDAKAPGEDTDRSTLAQELP